MNSEKFITVLSNELIKKHKCHTVFLYGSRARGDFSATSDYDIMAVKKSGKKHRLVEKRNGQYLDIFIFPEKDLEIVNENHLYMRGAKILYQKDNYGSQFLKKLNKAEKRKFVPMTSDEMKARRVWLHKMYDRALLGDIEGKYRLSWLKEALLFEYFNLRKKRYWGSKISFAWLQKNDKPTYNLFNQVLSEPTDMLVLKKLVVKVSALKF